MLWPTICKDNFFRDLPTILEYAKTLTYKPDYNTPGERSENTFIADSSFFYSSTASIVALLYPNDWRNLRWSGEQYFQRIPSHHLGEGWVHRDTAELSSVVYLKGGPGTGTSLYRPKGTKVGKGAHVYPITGDSLKVKENYLKDPASVKKSDYLKALKENNDCYHKTVTVEAFPNRIFIYDSSQFHGAHYVQETPSDRLTVSTFLTSIAFTNGTMLRYPLSESHRARQ